MSNEQFVVKDSGKRMQFESGMVRDTTEGKTDYTLVLDGPMFKRWAEHLTKGAIKYSKRNWMKADGQAELDRFKESALRHFLQWFWGDIDEDHAAAVLFNINSAEYVKDKMGNFKPSSVGSILNALDQIKPQEIMYKNSPKTPDVPNRVINTSTNK